MIGFDLDGVLISDLNFPPEMTVQEFLEIRQSEPKANFVPKGNYVIITGRPVPDLSYTLEWVERELINPPSHVYHGNEDVSKGEVYKAKIINEIGIHTFIESCPRQVEYLTEHCPQCKIIHFGSFVSEKISNLF